MSAATAAVLPEQATEEALSEILASPPFGRPEIGRQLINRLVDWYETSVADMHTNDPVIFWAVVVGLSILLALLLWHLAFSARAVWRSLRADVTLAADSEAFTGKADLGPARHALAAGDARRAVELAWSAVVAAWALPGESARTPRQQARAFESRIGGEHRPYLRGLLTAHEAACYAGASPDPSLARGAIEQASRLVAPGRDG